MNLSELSIQFYIKLDHLISDYENKQNKDDLQKIRSLINEGIQFISKSEIPQLVRLKEKLIKVDPQDKLIQQITEISQQLTYGKTFTDLPPELLISISGHLDLKNLYRSRVCGKQKMAADFLIKQRIEQQPRELTFKQFLRLACQLGPNLENIVFNNRKDLTNENLEQLVRACPNLKNFKILIHETITNNGIKVLFSLEDLEKLDLRGIEQMTDEVFKNSPHLPRLKEFNLIGCNKITDEGLKTILPSMTKLERLDLSYCNGDITDKCLTSLSFNQLRQLNLQGIKKITGEGLKAVMPSLMQLEKLDLSWCPNITDEDLKAILPYLMRLEWLSLNSCKNIAYENLKDIFPFLKQLKRLDLDNSNITNQGLQSLIPLKQLVEINLSSCPNITSEGLMAALPFMTQLERLKLASSPHINDECLKALLFLKQLTELSLTCCSNITDNGLKSVLPSLPQLKLLNLLGCEQITREGIKAVKRPNLELLYC